MNNLNESQKGETKNITLGLVISWIFGVLVGISGLVMLFSKPIAGILVLLAAVIVLPPVNKTLKKKYNFSLSGGVKFLLVIILFVIAGVSMGSGSTATQPIATQSVPAVGTASTTTQPTQATTASAPVAPQVLLTATGSGSKTTQSFTAAGNWTLDWSYDCSKFGDQGNFQVYIYNDGGSMSFSNGPVNQLGKGGADTEYYHNGGTYYLQVNSECKWKINVKG